MHRLTALFAATTLIAGIAAGYLWQELRAERQLTAQLREQGAPPVGAMQQDVNQSLPTIEVQTGPSVAVGATAAPPAAGMAVATTSFPPRAAEPASPGNPSSEPEYATTSLKLNQLQGLYPSVVKELGMTPAEAEAFYDLIVKQQRQPNPVRALLSSGGVDEQELKRAQAEFERAQQAEIAAMLGPARTRQWQDYLVTVEARRRVNELTSMLSSTSPLSEKQSAALVNNIIAEQARRAQDEKLRTPAANDVRAQLEFEETNLQRRIESNRRTVDVARSFLNADQLTLMQDAQTRGNERIRAGLKARRERLESGAGNP